MSVVQRSIDQKYVNAKIWDLVSGTSNDLANLITVTTEENKGNSRSQEDSLPIRTWTQLRS